jgi:hypothetical protein
LLESPFLQDLNGHPIVLSGSVQGGVLHTSGPLAGMDEVWACSGLWAIAPYSQESQKNPMEVFAT